MAKKKKKKPNKAKMREFVKASQSNNVPAQMGADHAYIALDNGLINLAPVQELSNDTCSPLIRIENMH